MVESRRDSLRMIRRPPVELDLIPLPVCQQRFAPAADGCERRSQLMGHRRDKFRFHFLVLADLHGHIVDIIHQLAQLAGILVFQAVKP